MKKYALLLTLGGLLSPTAGCGYRSVEDIPAFLIERADYTRLKDNYIYDVQQVIRQHGTNGEYLERKNIKDILAQENAHRISNQFSRLLRYDVDGDGNVTTAEIHVKLAKWRFAKQLASKRFAKLMKHDRNGDGIIANEEMHFLDGVSYSPSRLVLQVEQLLALDPNKDQKLTIQELTRLAENAFEFVDANNDSLLSQEEMKQLGGWVRYIYDADHPCALPDVSKNAKIVLYGIYDADAISSVSIAGQDMETGVVDISIDEGQEPIYLILSTYDPIIWRLTGDVRRLEKVVALSTRPAPNNESAVGITGLRKEQVFFAPPKSCFELFQRPYGVEAARAKSAIKKAIGRTPDVLAGSSKTHRLSLPSNKRFDSQTPPVEPEGFDKGSWPAFIHYFSQGIFYVNVEEVISPYPASEYDIFPGNAGISQLVASGHLVPLGSDTLFQTYKIVKKISRFPAEVTGSFVLGKGVPMPEGDPGYSCVISEENGEVLVGNEECLEEFCGAHVD